MLKTIFSNINSDLSWIENKTIYLTKSGSYSYVTNIEGSDEDFRGITIPPIEYHFGFNKNFDQLEKKDPDITIFSIKKFIKLASDNNPNCLELLFTDEKDHLFVDSLGEELLSHRDEFLSKLCKERYLGYAKSQLHRVKSHRRWILNPPKSKPERKDFSLKETPVIPKEQLEAIWSQINKKIDQWNPDFEPFSEAQKIWLNANLGKLLAEMQITSNNSWECAARTIGLNENFIHILQKEREYDLAVKDWNSFQEWKENRNPKRYALEEKYHMDLKHVMHLVRLSRTAKEILETGKLIVKRPDAEELISIRLGSWNYDQVIEYMSNIEKEIKIAYDKSLLQKTPNRKKIDNLCIKLVEKSLSKYSWYSVKKYLNQLFR